MYMYMLLLVIYPVLNLLQSILVVALTMARCSFYFCAPWPCSVARQYNTRDRCQHPRPSSLDPQWHAQSLRFVSPDGIYFRILEASRPAQSIPIYIYSPNSYGSATR